jgi:hypothetical protein
MAGIHIAALFETSAAAHAAHDALIAAGIEASRILVLDRGHADKAGQAHSRGRVWGALKHLLVPDDHAHAYGEGVTRGHPLLLATVTEAEQAAAVAAVQSAHPLNVDAHAEGWREEGWSGVYDGEDEFLASSPMGREAAGSEGIVDSGLLVGDYGAVGGMIGGRANTDILRGKSFLRGPAKAEPVDSPENVQVYAVKPV